MGREHLRCLRPTSPSCATKSPSSLPSKGEGESSPTSAPLLASPIEAPSDVTDCERSHDTPRGFSPARGGARASKAPPSICRTCRRTGGSACPGSRLDPLSLSEETPVSTTSESCCSKPPPSGVSNGDPPILDPESTTSPSSGTVLGNGSRAARSAPSLRTLRARPVDRRALYRGRADISSFRCSLGSPLIHSLAALLLAALAPVSRPAVAPRDVDGPCPATLGMDKGGGGGGSSPSSSTPLPRGVSRTSSPSLNEPRSWPSDIDE